MSVGPICVLGGGNGGQCMAADLALAGHRVRLYEHPRFVSRMRRVFEDRRIEMTGIGRTGVAEMERVTTDMAGAVRGASIVHLVVPAYAQEPFFAELVEPLEEGQLVVIWAGCLGSLRLRRLLGDARPGLAVTLCETHTLPYGVRLAGPGRVNLLLSAPRVLVAGLPAGETGRAMDPLRELFPGIEPAGSVLEAALNNPNPIVHPAGSLLNTGAIQHADGDFHLYREGITRSVARVIRGVYAETARLASALGVEMIEYEERDFRSTASVMGAAFRAPFDTVGVIAGVEGPHGVEDRYFLEDLAFGLVPVAQLADRCSVPVPLIRSLVEIGGRVCDRDFWREGRQLADLGLDGAGPEEIVESVMAGGAGTAA